MSSPQSTETDQPENQGQLCPSPVKAKLCRNPAILRRLSSRSNLSESIEKTVENISEFVNASARGLRFRVDDASGRTVVTVVNPNSGEIIRQIPTEEFLQIASELRRYGEAHLLDKEA